jgi:hypothetical protein
LAHAVEQQSPSTSLPSSHCSLAWLTRPSPQRGGGSVLVVEVLEVEEVLELVDDVELVEVEVDEVVDVDVVDDELLDVVLEVEEVVDVDEDELLVVELEVDVVVVVRSLASRPPARMRSATTRPIVFTPGPSFAIAPGAQRSASIRARRAKCTRPALA